MGAKPKPVFGFDSVFFFVQGDEKKKKKTGWLCVSGGTPPPQSRRNPIRASARSSIYVL